MALEYCHVVPGAAANLTPCSSRTDILGAAVDCRGQHRPPGGAGDPAGLLQEVPDGDRLHRLTGGQVQLRDITAHRGIQKDPAGVHQLHHG